MSDEQGASDAGRTTVGFVCVQNAGRSQMATAFAERELAERDLGDEIRIVTGGTDPAEHVHDVVVDVMADVGFDLADRVPREVTFDEIQSCDYVVTMGCAAEDGTDDADADDEADEGEDDQAPLGALFDAGPAGPVRTDGGDPGGWEFGVDTDATDEAAETDERRSDDAADDDPRTQTRTRTPPGGAPADMTATDDTDHDDSGDRVDRAGPDADAPDRDAPPTASTPGPSATGGDRDGDTDAGDASTETRSGETTAADAERTDDSGATAESASDADADVDVDADEADAEPGAFRELRRRLPASSQVLLFTPALDDDPVTGASRVEAFGHPVTVVSPNVIRTDTAGGGVAGVERDRRLRELRRAGAQVVDWAPDEPVELALARGVRRWSA
jgi:arsenate reductase